MDFKAGVYDASGSGIIGSSDMGVKVKRDADDYFYDFNDDTFKVAGWVSISGTLVEVDATNVPGEYEFNEDVSGWENGVYTAYFQYAGVPPWTDAEEFRVWGGKEISEAIEDGTDFVSGVVDHASYGNAQLVRSTTPANTLDVDGSNRAAAKVEAIDADTITLSSVADTLIEALSRYGYVDRSITQAAGAVGAQNITASMAAAGCIQYETIKVSKTRDWGSPDITYYLLWHYDANGDVDEVKPDTDTIW